jgi:hypothetical protein
LYKSSHRAFDTAESKTISFHTPLGIMDFPNESNNHINPETGKPYQYVHVHGNTWRTEFIDKLPRITEAFTPGAPTKINHRGTYFYCPVSEAYIKMD